MSKVTSERFLFSGGKNFFRALPDPVGGIASYTSRSDRFPVKFAAGPSWSQDVFPKTSPAIWAAVSNFSPTAFTLTEPQMTWVEPNFQPYSHPKTEWIDAYPEATWVGPSAVHYDVDPVSWMAFVDPTELTAFTDSTFGNGHWAEWTPPVGFANAATTRIGQRDAGAEIFEPSWFRQVETRLEHLLELPPNWDGSGADPVAPEAAARASIFLWRLLRLDGEAPEIVPDPDGGLQLEWHTAERDLEVQIGPIGAMRAWSRDAGTDVEAEAEFTLEGRSFSEVSALYEATTRSIRRAA